MINSIQQIESIVKNIPDFIRKKFENEDKTLKKYDLLNYFRFIKDMNVKIYVNTKSFKG